MTELSSAMPEADRVEPASSAAEAIPRQISRTVPEPDVTTVIHGPDVTVPIAVTGADVTTVIHGPDVTVPIAVTGADVTTVIHGPDVTAPIFVDGSGRRGRRLRLAVHVLIALALVLLVLWWVSQFSVAEQFG